MVEVIAAQVHLEVMLEPQLVAKQAHLEVEAEKAEAEAQEPKEVMVVIKTNAWL
tara:strand:+ start:281 stop:442 length:162 start_codon:yes stop_codon:yes gene_type:complete